MPLCENWQAYISRLYARYAALEPSIPWVEDDFRLHNHAPLCLGGCFCERHMALYMPPPAKRLPAGSSCGGVLQPGEPHPYRKIWLDVSRDTMLRGRGHWRRGAGRFGKGQGGPDEQRAPHPRGRGARLARPAARTGRRAAPVDRVHLPGYQEASPAGYMQGFNMVSMLTRAFLPPRPRLYPELENFPFSRFSVAAVHPLPAAERPAAGPGGHDHRPVRPERQRHRVGGRLPGHAAGHQGLPERPDKGAFFGERQGVRVLCSPNPPIPFTPRRGGAWKNCTPMKPFGRGCPPWACPTPIAATRHPGGQVVAAAGQVLRNWNAETLERLFRNNFVLLTGDALETPVRQGPGGTSRGGKRPVARAGQRRLCLTSR